MENLTELLQDTVAKMRFREQYVQDLSGRWYSMKIQPYKTPDKRIDGAILALTNIDDLRRARESLHSLEAGLQSLVRHPPDLLRLRTLRAISCWSALRAPPRQKRRMHRFWN